MGPGSGTSVRKRRERTLVVEWLALLGVGSLADMSTAFISGLPLQGLVNSVLTEVTAMGGSALRLRAPCAAFAADEWSESRVSALSCIP